MGEVFAALPPLRCTCCSCPCDPVRHALRQLSELSAAVPSARMQSELGKRYVEYAVTVTGFDLGDEPGPDGRPLVEAAAHSYTVWRRYSDFVK